MSTTTTSSPLTSPLSSRGHPRLPVSPFKNDSNDNKKVLSLTSITTTLTSIITPKPSLNLTSTFSTTSTSTSISISSSASTSKPTSAFLSINPSTINTNTNTNTSTTSESSNSNSTNCTAYHYSTAILSTILALTLIFLGLLTFIYISTNKKPRCQVGNESIGLKQIEVDKMRSEVEEWKRKFEGLKNSSNILENGSVGGSVNGNGNRSAESIGNGKITGNGNGNGNGNRNTSEGIRSIPHDNNTGNTSPDEGRGGSDNNIASENMRNGKFPGNIDGNIAGGYIRGGYMPPFAPPAPPPSLPQNIPIYWGYGIR